MDEETRAHLDAMEGRLMSRIDILQEQMVDRFRGVDTAFRRIDATLTAHTELMRSHTEMMRNTNTPLDHGKRITDLEKK
jgi:hypothetical protein